MKYILIVIIISALTVILGTQAKISVIGKQSSVTTPLVAGIETTNKSDVNSILDNHWDIYVDNVNGFRLKHPSNISLKKNSKGDLSIKNSGHLSLSLTITSLLENETLNTHLEKIIDTSKSKLKTEFSLVETITPIAIGSVTALTYISEETNNRISYYYIPLKQKKYLVIANHTPESEIDAYQTAEKIIFSLEIVQ